MEDIEMSKNVIFTKAVAVAAAVALCFVGSNGICYAATGDTWVEKMIVYFNGEPKEMDVEVKDLGGGDYSYTMEVPDNSSGSAVIVTDGLSEEVTFCVDTEEAEVTVPENTEKKEEESKEEKTDTKKVGFFGRLFGRK